MFTDVFTTRKMQRAEMVLEYLQVMLRGAGALEEAARLEGIKITDLSAASAVLEILRGMKARVVPAVAQAHHHAFIAVQEVVTSPAQVAVHAN